MDSKVSHHDFCQEISLEATTEVDIMRSQPIAGSRRGLDRLPKKVRDLRDQLETAPGMQSKIADRCDMRKERPRVTPVADF